MGTRWMLASLGVVSVCAALWASPQSTPPVPPPKPEANPCVKACWDEYQSRLSQCKSACWVCTFEVLGICVAGGHDRECLTHCRSAARQVFDECAAACVRN